MLKKILNFIYSKKINPPYCERTIFGIKITTKPARLSIEYHFNKRLDHLYSYIWDRHCEVNDRFSDIKYFCNKLEKEIIISRSLPKNIINENNPLISVVITVYDIEDKYLRHCLESVINQSYKNIEIIIVNDCSNFVEDEQICLEYASKDSRIKYIKHKENMGDGIARMTGLKEAKGYAVHFMDGDDYLDLSLYEICITYMIKGNVDIVCFDYYSIVEYNDNYTIDFPYYRELMPYTSFIGNEVLDTYCKKNQITKGFLWNKLFKRELLLKLGFDNIPARYKCKDMNYGFKIFSIANSFIYLPNNLYFHMESRINSFVNRGLNKDTFFTDIYNIFLDLYNFVDKKEDDKITELFLSNLEWIYKYAEKFNNEDDYYTDLLGNLIYELVKCKALNFDRIVYNNYEIVKDIKSSRWLSGFIYKQIYNQFIYNEVLPKTVLIIEFNNIHGEMLPSYVKYFLDIGYKVDVLTTFGQKICKSLDIFSNHNNVNIFYTEYNILENIKEIINKNYSFILFNTLYSYKNKNYIFDYIDEMEMLKNKIIFIDNNFELLDNKLINNRVIILKSFSKETDKIFVNPSYFGNVRITQKNTNITKFILVGQLEDKRRDTNLLISSIKDLINLGYNNFKLTIISRLGKPPYEVYNLYKYINYKENLDYINMYKEIEEADFFLPMLNPENIEHIAYIKNKVSGSFQLILGFLKIAIINREFSAPYGLNEQNSIIYDNNEDLTNAMIRAIKMNNKQYLEKQNSLKEYRSKIYNQSLDNLKSVINNININE